MTRTQAGQRFYRVRMHRTSAQLSVPHCMATPKGGEALGARVAYQERASASAHIQRTVRRAVGISEAKARG